MPKNSVGTKQLRKEAVRTADIRRGAVKLDRIDKAAQDALRGQAGAQGATGPQGAAGGFDSVVIRAINFKTAKETFSGQSTVLCEPGQVAVGGGAGYEGSPGGIEEGLVYSAPAAGPEGYPVGGEVPTGWASSLYNAANSSKIGHLYAVCAK